MLVKYTVITTKRLVLVKPTIPKYDGLHVRLQSGFLLFLNENQL